MMERAPGKTPSVASTAARYGAAILAPAVVLVVLTAVLSSEALLLGFWLGLAAVIVLLTLAGLRLLAARVFRRQRTPVKDPGWAQWLLASCCAVTTGIYWFLASLSPYEEWELGGVLALVTLLVLFWVPSILLASLSWWLEEMLVPAGGWPRLRWMLALGTASAFLGLVLGAGLLWWYDTHYDRTPLSRAVNTTFSRVEFYGKKAAGPDQAWLRYELRDGHLHIWMDLALPLDSSGFVRDTMQQVMEGARELLRRRDTREVTLTVQVGGRRLLRFAATEADIDRPVWDLAVFHKELLPAEGP